MLDFVPRFRSCALIALAPNTLLTVPRFRWALEDGNTRQRSDNDPLAALFQRGCRRHLPLPHSILRLGSSSANAGTVCLIAEHPHSTTARAALTLATSLALSEDDGLFDTGFETRDDSGPARHHLLGLRLAPPGLTVTGRQRAARALAPSGAR